jgi:molybdopterin converting factor subunit 1
MMVQVKLFAGARQRLGQSEVQIDLPDGATVGQLRQELTRQYGELSDLLPHIMFAVNQDYANDTSVIPANAEIAIIPPVSGG